MALNLVSLYVLESGVALVLVNVVHIEVILFQALLLFLVSIGQFIRILLFNRIELLISCISNSIEYLH
jgi:hypothetical protein